MKENTQNNKLRITPSTIIRTAILALALVNQVLAATGHSIIDVSDEDINTLVTTIFTVAAAIAAWWKNNSFTQAAIAADEVLKEKKLCE